MKAFTLIEVLITVAIVAIIAIMVWTSVWNTMTCVEWRNTGGTNCYGHDGYMHCEPERECVRRRP